MKSLVAFALSIMVLSAGASAAAQPYLVDTGAGTSNSGLILDGDPQVLDWTQSWHAGLFSLSQDSVVGSVEAWMSVIDAGDLTVAIYDADAGLPRSSPALFSATFHLNAGGRDWYGTEGLNWQLAAGSYWVDLEPAHTSTLRGALWMLPPDPLAHYAESIRGSTWEYDPAGQSGLDEWALRIGGAAVPEPSAWAVVLLGFSGVGMALRRSRRAFGG